MGAKTKNLLLLVVISKNNMTNLKYLRLFFLLDNLFKKSKTFKLFLVIVSFLMKTLYNASYAHSDTCKLVSLKKKNVHPNLNLDSQAQI